MHKVDSMGWSPKHFKDVHGGVLDAHTKDPMEIWRVGEYYCWPTCSYATAELVADRLYAMPLLIARDITIDRMAVYVATESGGHNARLGIYKNGTNLYPGTLLLDAGTVSVGSTGLKEITGLNQKLIKGIYFVVIVTDGTPTMRVNVYTHISPPVLGLVAASIAYPNEFWIVTFSYAALPDPYTAGGALAYNLGTKIAVRVASLD